MQNIIIRDKAMAIKSLELCPSQIWNGWGKFSLFIILLKKICEGKAHVYILYV